MEIGQRIDDLECVRSEPRNDPHGTGWVIEMVKVGPNAHGVSKLLQYGETKADVLRGIQRHCEIY